MRIAIAGAGIGGLSTAVGLQRLGAEVTVVERAAQVRSGGSGLSLFANGLAALDALGLRSRFDTITDPTVARFTAGQRTPDGRWIARVPAASLDELRIVDRADLHRILLSSLDEGTVRTSAEVASARADGSLVLAPAAERTGTAAEEDTAAEAAPAERFDLVIGADGVHSRVREAVAGVVPIRYSGYSAWRGLTSAPFDLDEEAGESVGHGRRFGIAPLADGRVYWFAVANMPEDAVFASEKAAVEQLFSGWHTPIGDLVAATEAQAIRRTPIVDLGRRLPSYHRGRVVLIGDAAHAMTPNLGQGGGQALEDAATLTALLSPLADQARPDDARLARALERYDRLRRRRSQSIAAKSRIIGTVFQLESRPLVAARNALVGLLPGRVMAAQALSVQKWEPPTP